MPRYQEGCWIVVLWIDRFSKPVYCGQMLALAADALHPGTCYGVGATEQIAMEFATEEREWFLND